MTFGFKLPANPVGEGIMSIAMALHILPSSTGLAGNLNPKVVSICYFQMVGARNIESTHLLMAIDGNTLRDLHTKIALLVDILIS